MKEEKILLAHGSGGKLMHNLIKDIILQIFNNQILEKLDDSGIFELGNLKLAYTTDSYVISPIFFKGGDIGKLAVCGTVNDLAMVGAQPLYLTASLIIEEGFPIQDLQRILNSMQESAKEAGVSIIAGDTKVVEAGKADKIFITTSGIGIIDKEINISGCNLQVGDKIIINGYIADHGISILSEREGLNFETELESDCAALNGLVRDMLNVSCKIRALRDPTRGGVATALNELAKASGVGIILWEEAIPIREEVKGACELLGLDPLYVANEGKLIAVVASEDADRLLECMRKNKYGKNAKIIGEVVAEHNSIVCLRTSIGGRRIIDMLVGEQLPRIC